MKRKAIKINEKRLGEIIRNTIKESMGGTLNDFVNYVINRFNQEGIEIGDAGDMEELYQGCGNYDYETVPFDELYDDFKEGWLQYKAEQNAYHGLDESVIKKAVSESMKKALKEKVATMPFADKQDIKDLHKTTYNLDKYPRHKDYSSYAEVLEDIDSHFRAIVPILDALESPSDFLWNINDNSTFKKYVDYIDKSVERLRIVVARMRDLAIMKNGGEPDKSLLKGIYRNQ